MGFASLAFCSRTASGDALKSAWLDHDDDQWRPITLVNQTCSEVEHFGAWFGSDVGQFFYSTDDHMKFLYGDASDPSMITIDSAAEGGWIGHGLSAKTNIVDYWMAYMAYDPASGETSLRMAFSSNDGGWQTLEGPAGDFAAWTHLEQLNVVDGRPIKISVLYYDNGQGALKRATWPPDPDFFLPLIQ